MSQNLTPEPSAKSASLGLFKPEMGTTWSLIINHQSLINSSGLWTKGTYCKAAEGHWTLQCAFIWGTWWPSKGGWWSNLLLGGRVTQPRSSRCLWPDLHLHNCPTAGLQLNLGMLPAPQGGRGNRESPEPPASIRWVGFNQRKEGRKLLQAWKFL